MSKPTNNSSNNQGTSSPQPAKPVVNQSSHPVKHIFDNSTTARPKPNNVDTGGIQTKGIKP